MFCQQLTQSLDTHYPGKWELNPGDGAFYGPKIDITIKDALKRSFQCATIQLDFQLPERFNLKYRAADEAQARPVIIHRAIMGSMERFIAIITEHFAGNWSVLSLSSCPWRVLHSMKGHSGFHLVKFPSYLLLHLMLVFFPLDSDQTANRLHLAERIRNPDRRAIAGPRHLCGCRQW